MIGETWFGNCYRCDEVTEQMVVAIDDRNGVPVAAECSVCGAENEL